MGAGYEGLHRPGRRSETALSERNERGNRHGGTALAVHISPAELIVRADTSAALPAVVTHAPGPVTYRWECPRALVALGPINAAALTVQARDVDDETRTQVGIVVSDSTGRSVRACASVTVRATPRYIPHLHDA